jgi:hypothetical protein
LRVVGVIFGKYLLPSYLDDVLWRGIIDLATPGWFAILLPKTGLCCDMHFAFSSFYC